MILLVKVKRRKQGAKSFTQEGLIDSWPFLYLQKIKIEIFPKSEMPMDISYKDAAGGLAMFTLLLYCACRLRNSFPSAI